MSSYCIHYTGDCPYTRFQYPRLSISVILFLCCEEHQYPIRGQILNVIIEPSPGLSAEVTQMYQLSIDELWRQFHIKMAIVIRLQVYALSLYAEICRKSIPAYNESHLYGNMSSYICNPTILHHHMAVQPKSGLGLPFFGVC
jgi:hypothetical protein